MIRTVQLEYLLNTLLEVPNVEGVKDETLHMVPPDSGFVQVAKVDAVLPHALRDLDGVRWYAGDVVGEILRKHFSNLPYVRIRNDDRHGLQCLSLTFVQRLPPDTQIMFPGYVPRYGMITLTRRLDEQFPLPPEIDFGFLGKDTGYFRRIEVNL